LHPVAWDNGFLTTFILRATFVHVFGQIVIGTHTIWHGYWSTINSDSDGRGFDGWFAGRRTEPFFATVNHFELWFVSGSANYHSFCASDWLRCGFDGK